ncbi:MAG TPA: pseudouridine-5'-phosphate glycosidase, partial [Acidimicrobiales bacterium]|nr:pseudouridine-5'-phosphate glycosidase [Acidimicrobiales bacterium]
GPAVTPYVLDAIAGETDGRSIAANLALAEQNAAVAAAIAVELAG